MTHEHYNGRRTESLLQRLAQIEINIEHEPTVVEVLTALRKAFDAERITKAFFKRFTEQQRALSAAIVAELDPSERDWYGSLLMNRLMFIYFMQRKGFMDGDLNYLSNRLTRVKALKGSDKFYEFYKDFLLPLFHEGLGQPGFEVGDGQLRAIIGDVPYVNGGLFAPHVIESAQRSISVPDAAFEKVFGLFDAYQWHLDDRPTGRPDEINPDVLGYIFEQFINQKSENEDEASRGSDKGAYYTAEDISGYMTASALVPVFFERLQSTTHLNPWLRLSDAPDDFVWSSVRFGVEEEIPPSIESVYGSPEWMDRPGSPHGLPGESWYEIEDRRRAYDALLKELSAGRVADANAVVTANLDLETLAVSVIDGIDGVEDVLSAWRCLTGIRIIDPTCGSGAFLFAALKQLQTLYQAVLDAARRHAKTSGSSELRDLLDSVDRHPNENYFILKHATLNNLYGVDIMPEATEIARLRLFLALVAAIDDRRDLEPLPDLDFNIKPGNTLVGAATPQDIASVSGQLFDFESAESVVKQAQAVRDVYGAFRRAQEEGDFHQVALLRRELRSTLMTVRTVVNEQWHRATAPSLSFDSWLVSHQPFHWFIEFPEVFEVGGFDVVIGNPPYVGRSKVTRYAYTGFRTNDAPDIYVPVLERATQIAHERGRFSMIVPLNVTWGPKYQVLRELLTERFASIWVSTFGIIPARLFPGLEIRNTILLGGPSASPMSFPTIHLSMYNKWNAEGRPHLFPMIRYISVPSRDLAVWPKVGHESLVQFASGSSQTLAASASARPTRHRVGFKKIGGYWLSVFRTDPPAMDGQRNPVPQKVVADLYFRSESDAYAALAVMSTRACFMWWVYRGDEFNSPAWTYTTFPLALSDLSPEDHEALESVGKRLDERLRTPGNHVLWTPYAGAWQGNFDLNYVRDITEDADVIVRKYVNLDSDDSLRDFDVEYAHFMKIGRERPGTVRGPEPDRDRS